MPGASPRPSSAGRSATAGARPSSPPSCCRCGHAGRTYEHGRLSRLRLGIDAIDLYQVHAPNPAVPVRSTMDGMRRLLDDGIIRQSASATSPPTSGAVAEPPSALRASNQVRTTCCSASTRTQPPPRPGQRPPTDRLQPPRQRHPRAATTSPTSPSAPLTQRPAISPRTSNGHPAHRGPAPHLRTTTSPRLGRSPGSCADRMSWTSPGLQRRAARTQRAAADLELAAEEDRELTDASDRYETLGLIATARGLSPAGCAGRRGGRDLHTDQRAFQDRFDARRMADRLTVMTTDVVDEAHQRFIGARQAFPGHPSFDGPRSDHPTSGERSECALRAHPTGLNPTWLVGVS